MDKTTDERYKKKLIEYIKKNLKAGFSIEDIKKKLMQSGLDDAYIDGLVLESYKKKNHYAIILIFLGIIIFASLSLFIYKNLVFEQTDFLTPVIVDENCLILDDPDEKYECYKSNSLENPKSYPCGWFVFLVSNKSIILSNNSMKDGEIIFKIDDKRVSPIVSKEAVDQLFWNKTGDFVKISTNKDTYLFKLFKPEGKRPTIYIGFEQGYCV